MNINNLTYKNNLNYKDNLNCNNSNSILNSKLIIINSNNNSTPNPRPLPLKGEGEFALSTKFNCKSIIFNFQSSIFNFSKSAFSLIELSIVLIVIGLLVAGVTGGASLIESAKMRALVNEARDWKQAVGTFYAARGRLPGDLNNDGVIGISLRDGVCVDLTHEKYTTSSFPGYSTTAPDIYVAPFIDLSLEGVIDFVPDSTDPTAPTIRTGSCVLSFIDNKNLGTSLPQSKAYKNLYWTNFATSTLKRKDSTVSTSHQLRANNTDKKIFISFLDSKKQTFKVKTAQKIDKKFDDGDAFYGNIRAVCTKWSYEHQNTAVLFGNSSQTYQNAINNSVECSSMSFDVF